MIKTYETPNGVKLFRDTETEAVFIVVDLAPALENYIIETSVTWSGTTTGDPYEFFTEREPKDGDLCSMLSNIITVSPNKQSKVIAKYLLDNINTQDWLES